VAGGPAGAARGREGADAARRRAGAAAAAAALGPDRPGVPLRDRRRHGVPRRSFPGTLAAARLSLHVRARVRRRVPVLLGDRGRLRRLRRPPRQPRRHALRGVAGSARETAGLPAADGLELPLGVLVRQRLQLRLPGGGHQGAVGVGRRRNGLGDVPARRARRERVRARGRRRLPHLLGVRARPGRPVGHVPVARPRATRPQRNRLLVAPPRRVRQPVTETKDTQRTRTIMSDLPGRTTVVVGASRGLGRGITRAFAEAGAAVVAVARTGPALAELATTSANIRTEVADAADATVAWSLLDQYEPEVLILVAGANPVMRPLQYQTWETFSVNWHTDVKIAFTWLREALLKPLPRGSRVVVVSSGAAINGSPASGGYAGSKATQRFIAGYAHDESRRAGLDITVTAVMPRMTPFGDVGKRGVRAYAARSGQTEEAYLKVLEEPPTT